MPQRAPVAACRTMRDGIFGGTDGLLTLDVQPSGSGYASTFDIGLQV